MTDPPVRAICQSLAIVILLFGIDAAAADLIQCNVARTVRVEMLRDEGSGADAKRIWVLKSLPSEEDVVANDPKFPKLRGDLQTAIKAVRAADEADPGAWTLQSFGAEVRRNMPPTYKGFTFQSPPPNSPDAGVFELDAFYYDRPPAREFQKPLEISVIVRGSKAISHNPVLTTLGELESRHVSGLGNLSEEDRRVQVFAGGDDVRPSGAVTWHSSADHVAAFEIAAFAFESAKKNKLQGSVSAPEEGLRERAFIPVTAEIEGYVTERFKLPGDWQVFPSDEKGVRVTSDPGTAAPWKIRVALQAVEEVKFHIQGIRIGGATVPLEDYPWAEKIALLEKGVWESQRTRFESLRGRLLTKKELMAKTEEVLDGIEREKKIVAAAFETVDHSIVFTALYQPRVTDLKAGIGYSTDKQLAGSISLTTQNLLVDGSLLKLSLSAGLEKQEGEFSYAIPYFSSRDGRITSVLDLNANYLRDDDQKLGLPESGFDESRLGGSVRNTFQFSKERVSEEARMAGLTMKEAPVGSVYAAKLITSAGLSDTRLGAPAQLQSAVESGQVLFLLAEVQQHWRTKLRLRGQEGLGEMELVGNARVKKGFELGPGDFDFLAADAVVTGTAYFGKTTSQDFLVRLTLGGATISGNCPVFEEFRLGGDAIVRGMEEGERIARGAFYDSVQVGVSMERLWSVISRVTNHADKSEATGGSSAPGGGLDLSKIYLSIFFDQAFITRRGSRDQGGSSSLEAVGASLQMAIPGDAVRGQLEFGYAWSPDSIHEHGRIFTRARFDL